MEYCISSSRSSTFLQYRREVLAIWNEPSFHTFWADPESRFVFEFEQGTLCVPPHMTPVTASSKPRGFVAAVFSA